MPLYGKQPVQNGSMRPGRQRIWRQCKISRALSRFHLEDKFRCVKQDSFLACVPYVWTKFQSLPSSTACIPRGHLFYTTEVAAFSFSWDWKGDHNKKWAGICFHWPCLSTHEGHTKMAHTINLLNVITMVKVVFFFCCFAFLNRKNNIFPTARLHWYNFRKIKFSKLICFHF